MNILDIPWFDRPGERLSKKGVKALSSSDLLAILLGKGKHESVMELSSRLLKKYDFDKLGELSLEELTDECKGDKVPALKILSFIELSKRYNKKVKGGYSGKPVTCAKDIFDMLSDEMQSYKKEVLKLILLDTKNKVVKVKDISTGTVDSNSVYPREIFKDAIKEGAFAVMLVHNHPSGDPAPSSEDIEITKKIMKSGKMLEIPVLDHIIIGKNKYWNWLDSES